MKIKKITKKIRSLIAGLGIAFALFLILEFILIKWGGALDSFLPTGDLPKGENIWNALWTTRTGGLTYLFLWITALGKEAVLLYLAAIVSVILWLYKKRAEVVSLWIVVLGSGLFVLLGKTFLHHARPGGFIPVYFEDSSSFPSGHAALALAFYGFLGVVASRDFKRYWQKILAVGTATVLIFGISWSRLYLGVHFPSDILAGLLVGGLWFYIGGAALRTGFFNRKLNPPKIIGKTKHWIAVMLILWWLFFFVAYALNWQAGLFI